MVNKIIFGLVGAIATGIFLNYNNKKKIHTVEMYSNYFQPNIITVNVGDTIEFVPSPKGHNSESIEGMIPKCAKPWKTPSGERSKVKFDVPGYYGYKCAPHYEIGMVGLIIVKSNNMINNLDKIKEINHPELANKAFKEIWKKLESKPRSTNIIRMENFKFSPKIKIINQGETIIFESYGYHNTRSIEGMIPKDSEPWISAKGNNFERTFDIPGYYGYECGPHGGFGMVGLIIVKGENMEKNFESAKNKEQTDRRKNAWNKIWEEVNIMKKKDKVN